jgi:phage shock protein PspC (stress-responsive transcriptional regulator)
MVTFYVAHAIKNTDASDVIRIVALLLVFFLPYVGMPAYYVLYIMLAKPPAWAMKPATVAT